MSTAKAPLTTPHGISSLSQLLHRACGSLQGLSFRSHLLASALLRLALIAYGDIHDAHSEVPYTDIDYKVVTDGARQVLRGRSPFERHTFRYSPLLAYIQLPNVLLHPACGKLIYACFDLLVAVLIYALVRAELSSQYEKAVQALLSKFGKPRRPAAVTSSSTTTSTTHQNESNSEATSHKRKQPERIALASACLWLYNPLTAVISTRGNGDSFSSFFVILTIYLLAKSEDATPSIRRRNWLIFTAGLSHGFAIHLRLYPLLFSLGYFLSLSGSPTCTARTFLRQLVLPSCKQLLLIVGTAIGLLIPTLACYRLYGSQYIYEAYLYHIVRKDVRHNFSLYFLMQYLGGASSDSASSGEQIVARLLIAAPQIFLLLYLSLSFGRFRQTLPFCTFSLAFVMVTFNSVVTSQYFVWYLALLPLCLNNFQSVRLGEALGLFALWLTGQGLWLLPAYLLEFRTWNTFYWIGAQGAVFFLINSFILTRLIQNYSFTSFKVNFKKLF